MSVDGAPRLFRCRQLRQGPDSHFSSCVHSNCKHADQGVPHPSSTDSGGVPHRPAVHDPGTYVYRQVLQSQSQTMSAVSFPYHVCSLNPRPCLQSQSHTMSAVSIPDHVCNLNPIPCLQSQSHTMPLSNGIEISLGFSQHDIE